jgi:hypothetical protein
VYVIIVKFSNFLFVFFFHSQSQSPRVAKQDQV